MVYTRLKNETKLVPFGSQNQKDYLYSLGIKDWGENHNLIEVFFDRNIESLYSEAMGKTIDKGISPNNADLVSIAYFALAQYCRPLLYKERIEEYFDQVGWKMDNNMLRSFGMYVISSFNDIRGKIETCDAEMLIVKDYSNFITSDNPSTMWIQHSGGMAFVPMTEWKLNEANPSLELILPLSPKYLLRLYINKTRSNASNLWMPRIRIISNFECGGINHRISLSKHRNLYSVDTESLFVLD